MPFSQLMQTKIINEGWASFWHNRILRTLELSDEEFADFACLHSAVCSPGGTRINPYYVGLKVLEDIEERDGIDKLFEVRELESDVSFLRYYLTEELCTDLDLFLYELKDDEWRVTSKDWQDVVDTLTAQLGTQGHPHITADDADHRGRRELYLRHHFGGCQLDIPFAEQTLRHVYTLWGRPVHLETPVRGKRVLLTCDGERVTQQTL